ncbi:MAG: hypothetical protein AAFO72_00015 [Pseudomonadota bacterium]
MRFLVAMAVVILAGPALAEMDYVTDRALCDLDYVDRSERGMTFTCREFFEIEFYCELKEPFPAVDGQGSTHMSIGYCQAPGEVFPQVFVVQSFAIDPDVLYIYQNENSEGTAFFNCRP